MVTHKIIMPVLLRLEHKHSPRVNHKLNALTVIFKTRKLLAVSQVFLVLMFLMIIWIQDGPITVWVHGYNLIWEVVTRFVTSMLRGIRGMRDRITLLYLLQLTELRSQTYLVVRALGQL